MHNCSIGFVYCRNHIASWRNVLSNWLMPVDCPWEKIIWRIIFPQCQNQCYNCFRVLHLSKACDTICTKAFDKRCSKMPLMLWGTQGVSSAVDKHSIPAEDWLYVLRLHHTRTATMRETRRSTSYYIYCPVLLCKKYTGWRMACPIGVWRALMAHDIP